MKPEPPLWQSGMFSPDGKYYIYTYSQMLVSNQYIRHANSTKRFGKVTYYLQILDCTTGNSMLKESFKSKEMMQIENIEGNSVWLLSINNTDVQFAPALFDIETQTMKFSATDLKKINPGVPMNNVTAYFQNTTSYPGIIFEAADGRKYRIDPATGKATTVSGDFERVNNKSGYCYQTKNNLKTINTTNGTRQKLYTGRRDKHETESSDDFIYPQFLSVGNTPISDSGPVTIYGENFFVFSALSTNDKKEMQLCMLDKNTLKTQWSINLPQGKQEMNNYNKERFFLKDKQLFVANSTNLSVINLDNGSIVNSYPLFDQNKID